MWCMLTALLAGPLPGSDAAWALTEGSPAVTLTVVGEGEDLSDPEWAGRIVLNLGELDLAPGSPVDRNGDGALTVLDWVRTGSAASLELDALVDDPRLRERPDRGDANGNGRFDPEDLVLIYADGVDDDGNGYVDDIAGWDFLERDPRPEPFDPSRPASSAAQVAAESCPGCSLLFLRASAGGLADAGEIAAALRYAASHGSAVILLDLAVPGLTPELEAAVAEADLPVVAQTGTSLFASRISDIRIPDPRFVLVSPPSTSPCGKQPLLPDLIAPSGDCPAPALGAAVAGLLGLMTEASLRGTREAPPPPVPNRATDLTRALRRTAVFRTLTRPAAAVRAVRNASGAPAAQWRAPRPGAVLDPTSGTIALRARLDGDVGAYAVALGPTAQSFETVAEGLIASSAETLNVDVPVGGLLDDPAASTGPDSKAFLLRLTLRGNRGRDYVETRRIYLDADLERLPAFPIELGAGAAASPRILAPEGGPPSLWVPLLDGRLLRISGRGAVTEALPARSRLDPSASPWARLSAPTLQTDPIRVISVAADGQLEAWLPSGDPPSISGQSFPLSPLRPAGSLAPAVIANRALLWSDPLGLWLDDARAGPIQAGAGPLAVQGAETWGVSRGGLERSDGESLRIPESPEVQGLLRLPGRGPVLAEVEGLGPRVVVAAALGLVAVEPRALDVTVIGTGPIVASGLSVDGGQILAWQRGSAGGLQAVALPSGETRAAPWDGVGAEIVVADVDGGAPEWIASGLDALYAVSENGRPAAGWPKVTGDPVFGVPCLGDLDGDGRLEIAAVTRQGRLFVWRTRGTSEGVRWGQRRRDAFATANALPGTSDPGTKSGCRCVGGRRPLAWGGAPAGLVVLTLLVRAQRPRKRPQRA